MRFPLIRHSVPLSPFRGSAKLRMRRGMTLLELTVVILVLLSLITILFIGARGWKRGSDRALCIVNIQNIQKGVRGYSNLYDIEPGATVTGLRSKVIGMGRFVESVPTCGRAGLTASARPAARMSFHRSASSTCGATSRSSTNTCRWSTRTGEIRDHVGCQRPVLVLFSPHHFLSPLPDF